MGNFVWPEWMAQPQNAPLPSAPPPDPMVAREEKIANDTRVEQALNQFLAAKQGALFDAPDAFYRTQGEDAIHAAPVVTKNLDQLRGDLVDGLGNDYQRQRLGNALDAQMQLTRDGMARHVAEQSLAWQRGVAQDRINILTKEAAQHHNDTDLVDALGHAAATAARAHSRVGDGPPGGEAEDAAAAQARSGVLGAAIQARLDRGDTAGANALFTQVQDQLDQQHAAPLQGQIDTAQRFDAAKAYADQLASPTPPSSAEEIEAQRDAALRQAAADHAEDPQQQALAGHFINQRFNGHLKDGRVQTMELTEELRDWLSKAPRGELERTLPMPALWNKLNPEEQVQLLKQLDQDGRPDGADDPQLAANTPGEAADAVPPGQVQLLPVPGSAVIEPSPQQRPDKQDSAWGEAPAESGEIQSDALPEPPEPGQQYAQSILPFLGKPPYYVPARPPGSGATGRSTPGGPKGAGPEVPKTPGQGNSEPEYKIPIPRQSGKESKDDIPSWAQQRGIRPRIDETPRQTAERAMNEEYPESGWQQIPKRMKEFNKLKKHYKAHYQDPKQVPIAPEGPYGIPGSDREASLPSNEQNDDIQPSVA